MRAKTIYFDFLPARQIEPQQVLLSLRLLNHYQVVAQFPIKSYLTWPGCRDADIVRKILRGDAIPAGMGFTDVHRNILGDQCLHLLMDLRIFIPVPGLQRKFLAAMRHHRELGLRVSGATGSLTTGTSLYAVLSAAVARAN